MSESIVDDVLAARYYQPGEKSWEDVCHRVANYIGDTDEERAEYYRLMSEKRFIPNSPCLMNAGTKVPMMSACFSIGISDDMNSILHTFHNAAIVMKYGGGVGIDFSSLRPKDAPIESTGGTSSGVVEFMKLFDAHVEAVKQGGRRRGAAIATLDIIHPDIEEFIDCKTTEGVLPNMNISVRISDTFMQAVDKDADWDLVFGGKVCKTVRARALYDKLTHAAWKYGEPGVIFIDEIKRKNAFRVDGSAYGIGVNPCGEVSLMTCDGGGESCNLGSINLSQYYVHPQFQDYDADALAADVRTAIHFLDKVIDKNFYPIPEIEKMTKKFRRLGLGVMGWHDLLIKCKIPYDSEEALHLANDVMGLINMTAENESAKMGDSRSFICNLDRSERLRTTYGNACRNIARTCIAPTGTIATIAGCSYGIEPVFSYVCKRNTWAGGDKQGYMQIHQLFEQALRNLYPYDTSSFNKTVEYMYEHGSIQDLTYLPEWFRNLFKTSLDIGYIDHVDMQAAFQKHVDNNISKTVNLSAEATVDDVAAIYKYAWEHKLKGITIYRSGSRENEVLELKKGIKQNEVTTMHNVAAPPAKIECDTIPNNLHRPGDLSSITFKRHSGCGKLYIVVSEHDGKPYEVFVNTDGKGGCDGMTNALGRMISIAFRNGVPTEDVVRQLRRVKCGVAMRCAECDGKSCADIIAKCISTASTEFTNSYWKMILVPPTTGHRETTSSTKYVNSETTSVGTYNTPTLLTKDEATPKAKCPECGEPLTLSEGCVTCPACGWSKCK